MHVSCSIKKTQGIDLLLLDNNIPKMIQHDSAYCIIYCNLFQNYWSSDKPFTLIINPRWNDDIKEMNDVEFNMWPQTQINCVVCTNSLWNFLIET